MNEQMLKDILGQLNAILGNKNDPGFMERFAAIHQVTRSHFAMLALDSNSANLPWLAEQQYFARDFLISGPKYTQRARDLVARQLVMSVVRDVSRTDLVAAVTDVVQWALFEDLPVEDGLRKIRALAGFGADACWPIIDQLINVGLYRLKVALPVLFADPAFRRVKSMISHYMYGGLPNLSEVIPRFDQFEEPLAGEMPAPRPAPQHKIRVAIWSHKIGNYMSSMTQVHPWLMNLPAPNLEIFILSERQGANDPVQQRYRQIYGANFIDCDKLDDGAFVEMVRGLDLDVFILLHLARPAMVDVRLGRCHLDIFSEVNLVGVPDRTLVSEGMVNAQFMSETQRKFVVIPNPPYVYSPLPAVPLKDRDPNAPFCFGVFNRFLKLHNGILDTWAQILHECPKSVLFFTSLSANATADFILQYELARRGVDPARVIAGPRVDHVAHLDRHNAVDLMLDTFPMGGGMTAVDTFAMGVPLIAHNDRRTASQQTAAFFQLLGPEAGMSAPTVQAYVDYAKAKYAAGLRTKAQREKLRSITTQSLLFDGDRYTKVVRKVLEVCASGRPEKMLHIDADFSVRAG